MPQTKSRTDNIRFLSSTTGEHVLDTYLEGAEKGGEELGELIDKLFDENGKIRDGIIEFREDPGRQGSLQTRPYDPDQGPDDNWETVMGFQWVTEEAERAKDWAQKTDGKVEADPDPNTGYSAKYWATRLSTDYDNLGFYYLGPKAEQPSTMNDGTQLQVGAVYFDTVFKRPFFWGGTSWGSSSSPASAVLVSLDYIASGGQTQFDLGVADAHGTTYTLAPLEPQEGVVAFVNGARYVLDYDSGTDQFTVDYTNNLVTFNQALQAGDKVTIDVLVPEERFSLAIKRIHLLQAFTPDGVTVIWPLQRSDIITPIFPTGSEEIEVFVDNTRQVPGVDYTVAGNNLTFNVAPRSYEEVWGLWNQPGGDAAGEYQLDRDPDPSLIGPLRTEGFPILATDGTSTEIGRFEPTTDSDGDPILFVGKTVGGVYDSDLGGVAFGAGGTVLGGAQLNAPSLKSLTGTVSYVVTDESGNLFLQEVPSDWSVSDTSQAVVDLGTGTTAQPWVAIDDLAGDALTVTTPQDTADGGVAHVYATLYVENKTLNRFGTIDVGFGIDGADPGVGDFKNVTIPEGFSGLISVDISYPQVGIVPTGTVLLVYARVASGSNSAFGVDVDGSISDHSMVLNYSAPVLTALAAGGDWLESDTSASNQAIAAAGVTGVWVAITGLSVAAQATALGGIFDVSVALRIQETGVAGSGTISIGIGIDAAEPVVGQFEGKSVSASFDGYADMDIRRVITAVTLAGTETLQAYARAESGDAQFSLDARGDLNQHSMVIKYTAP